MIPRRGIETRRAYFAPVPHVQQRDVDDSRLIAYVVYRPGQKPAAGDIGSYASERRPEYMVPLLFLELERIPLTLNGKADRKALPDPVGSGERHFREHAAPATPTEAALAEIWREVLKVEDVGVEEILIDLNGHSLLLMPVVSRIEKARGIPNPIRRFFTLPTVRALATYIDAQSVAGPLSRGTDTDSVSASAAGQPPAMWGLERNKR